MSATAMSATMSATATAPILNKGSLSIHLLKHEAIDRLFCVASDLPKYKKELAALIANFTVDAVLCLMNTIHRDNEFKSSSYYRIYDEYFDEIEDLIHNTTF